MTDMHWTDNRIQCMYSDMIVKNC